MKFCPLPSLLAHPFNLFEYWWNFNSLEGKSENLEYFMHVFCTHLCSSWIFPYNITLEHFLIHSDALQSYLAKFNCSLLHFLLVNQYPCTLDQLNGSFCSIFVIYLVAFPRGLLMYLFLLNILVSCAGHASISCCLGDKSCCTVWGMLWFLAVLPWLACFLTIKEPVHDIACKVLVIHTLRL